MKKELSIVAAICLLCGWLTGYGVTNWSWKKRQIDCFEEGRKFEREDLKNAKVYLWDDAVKIKIGGEVLDMKNVEWVGWQVK